MSLDSYKNAITRAKAKINEDAATVAELTKEQSSEKVSPTTFIVPATGINQGQLMLKLKAYGSPKIEITDKGDTFEVKTTNPRAVAKVLKELGFSATEDGKVADLTTAANNPTGELVQGESFVDRMKNKFKGFKLK